MVMHKYHMGKVCAGGRGVESKAKIWLTHQVAHAGEEGRTGRPIWPSPLTQCAAALAFVSLLPPPQSE